MEQRPRSIFAQLLGGIVDAVVGSLVRNNDRYTALRTHLVAFNRQFSEADGFDAALTAFLHPNSKEVQGAYRRYRAGRRNGDQVSAREVTSIAENHWRVGVKSLNNKVENLNKVAGDMGLTPLGDDAPDTLSNLRAVIADLQYLKTVPGADIGALTVLQETMAIAHRSAAGALQTFALVASDPVGGIEMSIEDATRRAHAAVSASVALTQRAVAAVGASDPLQAVAALVNEIQPAAGAATTTPLLEALEAAGLDVEAVRTARSEISAAFESEVIGETVRTDDPDHEGQLTQKPVPTAESADPGNADDAVESGPSGNDQSDDEAVVVGPAASEEAGQDVEPSAPEQEVAVSTEVDAQSPADSLDGDTVPEVAEAGEPTPSAELVDTEPAVDVVDKPPVVAEPAEVIEPATDPEPASAEFPAAQNDDAPDLVAETPTAPTAEIKPNAADLQDEPDSSVGNGLDETAAVAGEEPKLQTAPRSPEGDAQPAPPPLPPAAAAPPSPGDGDPNGSGEPDDDGPKGENGPIGQGADPDGNTPDNGSNPNGISPIVGGADEPPVDEIPGDDNVDPTAAGGGPFDSLAARPAAAELEPVGPGEVVQAAQRAKAANRAQDGGGGGGDGDDVSGAAGEKFDTSSPGVVTANGVTVTAGGKVISRSGDSGSSSSSTTSSSGSSTSREIVRAGSNPNANAAQTAARLHAHRAVTGGSAGVGRRRAPVEAPAAPTTAADVVAAGQFARAARGAAAADRAAEDAKLAEVLERSERERVAAKAKDAAASTTPAAQPTPVAATSNSAVPTSAVTSTDDVTGRRTQESPAAAQSTPGALTATPVTLAGGEPAATPLSSPTQLLPGRSEESPTLGGENGRLEVAGTKSTPAAGAPGSAVGTDLDVATGQPGTGPAGDPIAPVGQDMPAEKVAAGGPAGTTVAATPVTPVAEGAADAATSSAPTGAGSNPPAAARLSEATNSGKATSTESSSDATSWAAREKAAQLAARQAVREALETDDAEGTEPVRSTSKPAESVASPKTKKSENPDKKAALGLIIALTATDSIKDVVDLAPAPKKGAKAKVPTAESMMALLEPEHLKEVTTSIEAAIAQLDSEAKAHAATAADTSRTAAAREHARKRALFSARRAKRAEAHVKMLRKLLDSGDPVDRKRAKAMIAAVLVGAKAYEAEHKRGGHPQALASVGKDHTSGNRPVSGPPAVRRQSVAA